MFTGNASCHQEEDSQNAYGRLEAFCHFMVSKFNSVQCVTEMILLYTYVEVSRAAWHVCNRYQLNWDECSLFYLHSGPYQKQKLTNFQGLSRIDNISSKVKMPNRSWDLLVPDLLLQDYIFFPVCLVKPTNISGKCLAEADWLTLGQARYGSTVFVHRAELS